MHNKGIFSAAIVEIHRKFDSEKDLYVHLYQTNSLLLIGQVECMPPDSEALLIIIAWYRPRETVNSSRSPSKRPSTQCYWKGNVTERGWWCLSVGNEATCSTIINEYTNLQHFRWIPMLNSFYFTLFSRYSLHTSHNRKHYFTNPTNWLIAIQL